MKGLVYICKNCWHSLDGHCCRHNGNGSKCFGENCLTCNEKTAKTIFRLQSSFKADPWPPLFAMNGELKDRDAEQAAEDAGRQKRTVCLSAGR